MTSSIRDLVHSQILKRFNAAALIVAMIIGLALSGDRVNAADDPVSFNFSAGDFHLTANSFGTFYDDSYSDILIPVYCYLSGNNSSVYLNGVCNASCSAFSFHCSDNTNASLIYFEPINYQGLTVRYTNGSINLFFNDFYFRNGLSYPIGYFHISVATTASSTMIYVNDSATHNLTFGSSYTYATSYEYGLENAIISAINSASDVNEIITILNGIRNYTALLNSILDYLSQNRTLTEIYNQLVTSNQTQSAIYQEIYNYIHDNNSGAAAASQAAQSAGSQAANQAAAEASLAALSPGNMADLDSALQNFDLLDNVRQSTTFWTYCVNQFSTRSGALWGIFIFGLIIGLIAFILRLRR